MAIVYEEALERIQKIVEQLESGEMPLEDSVSAYEEGLKLIKECYQTLNKAEKKLEKLSGSLDDITTEPMDIE